MARCACQGGAGDVCDLTCRTVQPDVQADAVLTRVNELRAAGGCCGAQCFSPAPPLEFSVLLTRSAQLHATDMAVRSYLSHTGVDGKDPFERMRDAGFAGCAMAENIARDFPDAEAVVNAWLASDEHCINLFWNRVRLLGVGHAVSADPPEDYWVQNFGG
jgi:uncharacterized protein YkwD